MRIIKANMVSLILSFHVDTLAAKVDNISSLKYLTNFTPRLLLREKHMSENNSVRLNKYISESGICSRREADRGVRDGLARRCSLSALAQLRD